MNAAYREGLYFDGDIDIPIIDWRPYLEEVLDMHNSHQSFASRQRMLDHDGRASNQVIWFSAAGRRPDARGVPRDGRVDALTGRRPPMRSTAASRRRAPRSRVAQAPGTGS